MRRSIILPTLLIAAAALAVAACGSDDETGASATGASSSIVSIATVDGADVLTDSSGRTLYTAAVEEGGTVLCVDACTSFWAPILASASDAEQAAAETEANLGVVERPDGQSQLTFGGLPLYTFTEESAGELEGDGFTDDFQGTRFEWEAARAGGASPDTSRDGPGGGYGY
jgi:predicted lipoprotein with Yx(FWY)xxD motif